MFIALIKVFLSNRSPLIKAWWNSQHLESRIPPQFMTFSIFTHPSFPPHTDAWSWLRLYGTACSYAPNSSRNCITTAACCHFMQLSANWLCNFGYIITSCHIPTWPSETKKRKENNRRKEKKSRLKDSACANLCLSIQYSSALGKITLSAISVYCVCVLSCVCWVLWQCRLSFGRCEENTNKHHRLLWPSVCIIELGKTVESSINSLFFLFS